MNIYLRLLRYAKPYQWVLLGAAISMALAAALNVGALLQLQPIFDKIFSGTSSPAVLAQALKFYPALMLTMVVLKGVFSFTGDVLNGMATNKLTADIREEVYGKLVNLPLAYHTNSRAGQLMARVTNDINLMPGGISDVLGRFFGAGLNIVCIVGAVFWINWRLALIVMVAFPVCFGPLLHFSRRLRRHSTEGQERMADMTVQLHESLAGIRVIMSFGTQPQERARFKEAVWAYFRAQMRQVRASSASSPVMESIIALGAFFLVILAGHMVNQHSLTSGQLVALCGLLGSIYPQVKSINSVNASVQGALAGSQRVFALLDEPIKITEKPDAVEPQRLRQGLRFEDVSFEYLEGHPVLSGIKLEVKAGATVALVGPSGGGKTTLVDLVPRFHDPVQGRITLDGVDLRDLKLQSLRGMIGVVTQETFLFNDSIANNIRYGTPGATNEQVRAAAAVANAHEFIVQQPQGYDTPIGDRGTRLSGGQRQRLSIARAVLRNPPLLILDEATSALDTESERLVQQAIERLMEQRTSLVIAHRLSTVRHADLIVVVDQGRIVDQGRHEDLLAKDGLYARLCRLQFGGVVEAA
jgi:subfamily B ATP-binding cassette protein MsbA